MPHLIVNTVGRQHPSFLMVRGAIGWSSNVSIADDCKLYDIHLAKHKHKHKHKYKLKYKHKYKLAGWMLLPKGESQGVKRSGTAPTIIGAQILCFTQLQWMSKNWDLITE